MLIDWFTVVAQILNFVILIGLLKHFLYKPILEAVDAREKQIADQAGQAEKLKKEAGDSLQEFQRSNLELQQRSKVLMDTATADAAAERSRLLDQTQKENETLKDNFKNNYIKEQQDASLSIGRKTQQGVFMVVKKMLADIASVHLEDQIVAAFINRIHDLTPEEKKSMSVLIQDNKIPILVKSAFDLSAQQKELIESNVQEIFSEKHALQFATDPGLISGIECVTPDYKLSWNISEYLTTLETLTATNGAEAQL